MNESLDREYLSRPLVEDVTFEIGPTRISIHSPHTIYIGVTLPMRYQRDRLLETYRRVLRAAKAKGIRVRYGRHFSRTIKDRWAEYEAACEEMESLFRRLIEQAKRVQTRGIHYGSVDDMELSRLQKLNAEFQPCTYGTNAASIMASISYSLEELDRDLSRPSALCDTIYL